MTRILSVTALLIAGSWLFAAGKDGRSRVAIDLILQMDSTVRVAEKLKEGCR